MAAALATGTAGVSAHSWGATAGASDTPTSHEAATAAANLLWQRRQSPDDVSRSMSRPVSTAEAKVKEANSARETQRAKALARSTAAAAASRKKAEQSAKAARAKAKKRAEDKAKGITPAGWTCVIAGCGGTFTSGFGSRWGTVHLGDDFATPVGTPLRALHDGTVVAVGYYYGMGNRVEIDYGNGISSIFAHMTSFTASVGQQVSAGQVVGYSGNTGHSTGPHVHVEIHVGGQPVDPAPWLRAHGIF